MDQVAELERAILERAQRLAEEYQQRAQRSRDSILREASEKLRLREEREVLIAKALAERTFRQEVQANELRLRSEIDHTRWNLVEGVMERMDQAVTALVEDEERYLPLLTEFLRQGVELIPGNEAVAELNPRDSRRLGPRWESFAREVSADKRVRLAPEAIETVGGVRIRTPDNRIRIDHTFEGRRERLAQRLHQAISERLLPSAADDGMIFNG